MSGERRNPFLWAGSQLRSSFRIFGGLLLDRRRRFVTLLFVILAVGILEATGIALVMPLIAALQGQTEISFGGFPFRLELDGSVALFALLVLTVFVLKNAVTLSRMRYGLRLINALWHVWVRRIVDRQLYAPLTTTDDTDSGSVVTIGLTETRESAAALFNLLQLTSSISTFLFVYLVLWLTSWQTTLIASGLLAALGLFSLRPLTRRAHAAGAQLVESIKRGNSRLLEIVSGQRDIRAFVKEDYFARRIEEPVRSLEDAMTTIQWTTSMVHPIVETAIVGAFCIAVMVFSRFTPELGANLPVLAVFAAGAFRLFPVLSALSAQWIAVISKQAAATHVLESIGELPREREPKISIDAFREAITFDQVSLAYPGRGEVLTDISFHVKRGERVALVGGSGAGKSTLVSILMGFLDPTAGSIRIDGRPLSGIDMSSWRTLTGFVGQESIVFQADLAENISLGRVAANDERIAAASRAAGLEELVDDLPDGHNTQVGERGRELSGGQRQRVALARALLMRPSVLVLDEAMSGLDNDSIALTLADIRELIPDATWIMVAHRLHTVRDFDTLIVLRDGRVVETGSHAELVARSGYYAQLVARELAQEEVQEVTP